MIRGPAALRMTWGATLLVAPAIPLSVADQHDNRQTGRVLARILGARQLIQSAILVRWPTRSVILGSLAVDTTHLITMLLVAAVRPDLRRVALASSSTATMFVVLGIRQARR